MKKKQLLLIAAIFSLLTIGQLKAQVSITSTSSPYTQTFNTLKTSGSSAFLPNGWKLLETGSTANNKYSADGGGNTAGNTYSYGSGVSTDRALGSLQSGNLIPIFGVQILNSTGQTITSLTISFSGEQWRCGSAGRSDQLDFQYSLNAGSLSGGTWTDVNALDFLSPATTVIGVLDGNAAANRNFKSSVISGLSIPSNAVFWLRWTDFNASGEDDGLAIDDFSIQLTSGDVTPPSATSYNPANGSTGVALSGNLVINFNENVQKGSVGNITVKQTSDNAIVQTTTISSATVTISGATATIPFSGLAYSTGYYVNLDVGVFTDLAGNNFAGINASGIWEFNTQTPPLPTVIVNPASLAFGYIAAGTSSSAQTFSYTTTNITSSLTLTPPSGFEISGDNISFANSIVYTQAEAQTGKTVYVRFSPTASNTSYSGTINFSSTGLNDNKVNLSGNSNTPLPTLAVNPASLAFGYIAAGTSSSAQTFSYTTTNITSSLTLTPPSGFEISGDNISFANSIVYTQAEAQTGKTVYVRFSPTASNTSYSGTINFSSTGLNDNKVNLSGNSIQQTTLDTLKVVNWNIDWFGHASLGPADDNLQEQNVKTAMQNINADIYGLAEVVSVSRLQNIVSQMPGYSFIVSDFCSNGTTVSSCASAQKLAFVYRTSIVNKIRTYPMLKSGSANASYNWSSGRFPYQMEADVTMNGVTKRIQFFMIHGKANTSDYVLSYNRRRDGANEMHDSLVAQYSNSNWIVLGDYNDDLDKTITTQVLPDTTTSYISFKNDALFHPVTLPLSLAHLKSTVSNNDVIDHVTISTKMNSYYISNSARILKQEVESWIANYGTTTTDHYPVLTKYILSGSTARAATGHQLHAEIPGAPEQSLQLKVAVMISQLNLYITDNQSRENLLRILDLNGRVLSSGTIQTLDGTVSLSFNTSELNNGIYFVQVQNPNGVITEKVLINK